jgi:hypothetical protein
MMQEEGPVPRRTRLHGPDRMRAAAEGMRAITEEEAAVVGMRAGGGKNIGSLAASARLRVRNQENFAPSPPIYGAISAGG